MDHQLATDEILVWLLAGDPSIRWQVMRDLTDAPEPAWRRDQDRIESEGWGAELLSHQDEQGRWTPRLYGKKWISTTYSMVLLRRLGLPGSIASDRSCRLFLDEGLRDDGGIDVSVTTGRSETCVTGMVLGVLCWFGFDDPRRERLVDYLLAEQMSDGGWNCERYAGAAHSSLHTTTNVLEGLREYVMADGARATAAQRAEVEAQRFLAAHQLCRSHRTGEIVDPKMTRLSLPPRWRHDILRGLDYLQGAGARRDERLGSAIGLLEGKRLPDGRWPLQQRYAGASWFEMEQVGDPSRWNTLRALRVLRWWYGS